MSKTKNKRRYLIWTGLLVLFLIAVFIGYKFIFNPADPIPKPQATNLKLDPDNQFKIPGKNASMIINLTGFKDAPSEDSISSRILFKIKYPIIVSAFAEKILGRDSSEECKNYYLDLIKENSQYAPQEIKEGYRNNNSLIYYNYPIEEFEMSSINYYAYNQGYCFDFHFSTFLNETSAMNQTYAVIDSIRFIN